MARPRTLLGKISAHRSQPIGPIAIAKAAMKAMIATSRGAPHVTVEHPADQAQGDHLHGRADEQERPSPRLVHQGDGHPGEEQVDQTDPHRGGEGRVVQRPRRAKIRVE